MGKEGKHDLSILRHKTATYKTKKITKTSPIDVKRFGSGNLEKQ